MMAEARLRADWARTSNLLCLTANVHRDAKRQPRPFRPVDFDPFAQARRSKGTRVSVERLTREILSLQASNPARVGPANGA